ncbi:MAG: hypothetical protein LAP40_11890 [Acidobacteriia bacterium]|nr:hypothetical protein [Terriglobia bacterium]
MFHRIVPGCILLVASVPGFAQIDLSGSWASINHEDSLERGGGPYTVDYAGIPFNDNGRARALSYSQSQLSMPERICAFYTPFHMMLGPFGIKIWNETEPLNGRTVAWKIGAWEDRDTTTIWMDGRAHPSQYAPHPKGGFTTGEWDGEVLTSTTTDMPAGYIRRNGSPSSDKATMILHFFRHGDLLTVAGVIEDPVNLSEPYIITRSYQLSTNPITPAAAPCIVGDEGPQEGVVPHFLPDKNPFMDELTKLYGIPREAALGGAKTMYPDFRKEIKDKFVLPAKCTLNCGGPAGGRGGAGAGRGGAAAGAPGGAPPPPPR